MRGQYPPISPLNYFPQIQELYGSSWWLTIIFRIPNIFLPTIQANGSGKPSNIICGWQRVSLPRWNDVTVQEGFGHLADPLLCCHWGSYDLEGGRTNHRPGLMPTTRAATSLERYWLLSSMSQKQTVSINLAFGWLLAKTVLGEVPS